jgi:hypothetical protein
VRKSLWVIVAALLAVAATASIALGAVNVKSYPTATLTGTARYTRTNPQGHASPGQNPVPAAPGSGTSPLGNADHNGRGTINNLSATVTAPPTPTAAEAGCGGGGASDKWTVTLIEGSLTATAAQLVIKQAGSIIFCRNYTTNGIGTAC